ncbi:MAG: DUF3546 domain-containing protein, partial [archaeon]|nr:DUF3546 domain-containing protein [archaeon]
KSKREENQNQRENQRNSHSHNYNHSHSRSHSHSHHYSIQRHSYSHHKHNHKHNYSHNYSHNNNHSSSHSYHRGDNYNYYHRYDRYDYNHRYIRNEHSRSIHNDHSLNNSSQSLSNDSFIIDSKEEDRITELKKELMAKTKLSEDKINFPVLENNLVSFDLFKEIQENPHEEEELENAYKEYKDTFESTKLKKFYEDHKDDEWFKEKYDPKISLNLMEEKKGLCKKFFQNFFEFTKQIDSEFKLELNPEDEFNKSLKIVTYSYDSEKNTFVEKETGRSNADKGEGEGVSLTSPVEQISQKRLNIMEKPFYGFDPDYLSLFIQPIPTFISRFKIGEGAKKKTPGFSFYSITDPIKSKSFSRYCWLTFENEEKCELALDNLKDYAIGNDYQMRPMKSMTNYPPKVRITPPLFEERIKEDLELSKQIIEIFDKQNEIEGNLLLEENELTLNKSDQFKLDLNILYLRRVHGFCFYCIEKYEDERNLSTKCDNSHLRNYKSLGKRNEENKEENKESFLFDEFFSNKIKEFILGLKQQKEKNFVKLEYDFCKERILPGVLNKAMCYRCSICNKAFKGEAYVVTHIKNKHSEKITEELNLKIREENYMQDQNKLGDTGKIINTLEDYSNILNGHRKRYIGDRRRSPWHYKERRYSRERRRYPKKDRYLDLDDPENRKKDEFDINFDDL